MTESEGLSFHRYMKTPSRFLFDISNEHITQLSHISHDIMEKHVLQAVIHKPSATQKLTVIANVKHKTFVEGVVEEVNELIKTYIIRFLTSTKPIRIDYQGLS